ncbi:MAG: RnfABCDGE type electron transport complex subunit D [Thiomargarita sp.]|nr:RnfABCDGE type electron transport complex subunit D [Thiomargarita sp.]
MFLQSIFSRIWQTDPRHYQIAIQSILLIYGFLFLNFDISISQVLVIITTALTTQFICVRFFKIPVFDIRSPLSSALSLCLLLRTNIILFAVLAAIITILSKFLLRWNYRHIFNPSCFGLVAMLIITDQVWISAGQWGSTAIFGFLIACLGGLVINKAARSDVSIAFLLFYSAILFGRALWLGDSLTIPLHQLESGALLLFSFFMISDPKTTPESRIGRIIFAFLLACGAGFIYFWLYRTNGVFWSLTFFALIVPFLNWIFPGKSYKWGK